MRIGEVFGNEWQPTPVLLPEKFHGRNLVSYSPWGQKESDTTERIHFTSLHFGNEMMHMRSMGKNKKSKKIDNSS